MKYLQTINVDLTKCKIISHCFVKNVFHVFQFLQMVGSDLLVSSDDILDLLSELLLGVWVVHQGVHHQAQSGCRGVKPSEEKYDRCRDNSQLKVSFG